MGARFTIFGTCRSYGPAGWLALQLTKAGLNKEVWIWDYFHKQIHVRKQISIRCNKIEHWVHLRLCRYPTSTIHRYLDLLSIQRIQTHTSHIHNTTPPLPNMVQAPYLLPTYTTHTTTTKTQTHVQHSPCPHRIGKAQTQFSHPLTPLPSPPTPPRDKHIHMSHAPPTPLTTIISSTSPVLGKTPEPRVSLIYALTTTTPPPDPTPALPSPSHPHTITAHTHAT